MENQTFIIEDELKKLPGKPGVYLMHGEKDEIIYVGKAISLKNRVRQYFQPSRNRGAKIDQMVTHITRFEYIVTDSELEALVLECNLIKEHRPKYNTMLMDDKSYPFIKVTTGEAYPRIMMARQMKKDKSKYFGPYTSVTAVKDTIELIRKLYRLRSCNRILPRDIGKERCCLYHHIKQCDAPCQGYISQEKYRESVDEVLKFLGGNYDKILKDLEKKMQEASDDLEFEKAIEYRELLHSVKQIAQKQKITDTGGEDRDIVALAREHEDAVVQVFFIRNGRLIGRDHFYLRIAQGDENAEILSSFIKQFYAGTPYIPGELMLPVEPEEREILEAWLGEKRGHKVHFRIPKKGEKEKLVELAAKNAKMVLEKDKERIKREEGRTINVLLSFFERTERGHLFAVIYEFSVNFVGDDEKIMLESYINDELHFFSGEHFAGRISRIYYCDYLSLRRKNLLDLFSYSILVTVVCCSRYGYDFAACLTYESLIVSVERLCHDNFISVIKNSSLEHIDSL